MTASVSPSLQTAAFTVSWPACSVSFSLCATSCWTAPPAAPAPETTRASAAAAPQRSAATATCRVTWTAASSMPAASLQTAWRSAWSAAVFASPPEGPSQHVEAGLRGGFESMSACLTFTRYHKPSENSTILQPVLVAWALWSRLYWLT